MTDLAGRYQARRSDQAVAESQNAVLAAGEPGYENDTGLLKIGDGSSAWTDLPPIFGILGYGAACLQVEGRSVAVDANGRIISNLATSAANNRTVIQAAIDDIAGAQSFGTASEVGFAGGGTVFIGAGLWRLSGFIETKYGVSLKGAGAAFDRFGFVETAHSVAGTVLFLESGAPSVDIDDGAGTVNVTPCILAGRLTDGGTQSATNPHGTSISDLAIWMRANNTGTGIQIADTQFMWIERVVVTGANGSGGRGIEIRSTNPPDDGAHACHIFRSWLNYCDVGIEARGSGSTDGMIAFCRILQCQTASVMLGRNSGGGGWQTIGCHFTAGASEQDGTDEAHLILEAGPQIALGNYFDTNGKYDILANTALTCIVGNYFKGGTGGDPARIFLDGNGRKSAVVGNTAQAGTNDEGFVKLDGVTGDAARTVVVGNVLGDGGNSPVQVVIDASDNAVAESDTAIDTTETGGTNLYIRGNRMVTSSV